MTDLEIIAPPQTLSEQQKELVFLHIFRRLAAYRNTAGLYATLETSLSSNNGDDVELKRQTAFDDALNKWAQSLTEKAWLVCHPDSEGAFTYGYSDCIHTNNQESHR